MPRKQPTSLATRCDKLADALDRSGRAYVKLAQEAQTEETTVRWVGRSQACSYLSAFLRMASGLETEAEVRQATEALLTVCMGKEMPTSEPGEDAMLDIRRAYWLAQGNAIVHIQARSQIRNMLAQHDMEVAKHAQRSR